MEPAERSPEHEWLEKLVGEWDIETECRMGPGQPIVRDTGTETTTMLNAYWVVGDSRLPIPDGGVMRGRITLGFDPGRGVFIGTYVGDVVPGWFVYEGRLDDQRRVLTLDTTGPDCMDETKAASYRDIIELVDGDTRRFRSEMRMDDGTWVELMSGVYRRQGR